MLAYKSFGIAGGTFTVPAGVTFVEVQTKKNARKTAVAAGNGTASLNALILDESGNVYSAGNVPSVLGLNDQTARSYSTFIPALSQINELASTSDNNVAALGENGQLYVWGVNALNSLGVNDIIPRSSPILTVNNQAYSRVWGNNGGLFGLASNGQLYSIGNTGVENTGMRGTGTNAGVFQPSLVVGNKQFREVYNGGSYLNSQRTVFGIDVNNLLYAWGSNLGGQLGVGDTVSRSSPTLVVGGLTWDSVVMTMTSPSNQLTNAILGRTTAGILYTWGRGANGQSGNNDVISRSSPIQILGGRSYSAIAASPYAWSFYALEQGTGHAYSWGLNVNGELGLGDVIPRSSPTAVLGARSYAKIYAVRGSVFGITAAGEMYAWGYNAAGQLGLGDIIPRSSPTLITGGVLWDSILPVESPDGFLYANDTSGNVYAWGVNTGGNLGIGSITSMSSPTMLAPIGTVRKNPKIKTQKIAVTPGQVITVSVWPYYAKFGTQIVDQGLVDSLTVFYDQ